MGIFGISQEVLGQQLSEFSVAVQALVKNSNDKQVAQINILTEKILAHERNFNEFLALDKKLTEELIDRVGCLEDDVANVENTILIFNDILKSLAEEKVVVEPIKEKPVEKTFYEKVTEGARQISKRVKKKEPEKVVDSSKIAFCFNCKEDTEIENGEISGKYLKGVCAKCGTRMNKSI